MTRERHRLKKIPGNILSLHLRLILGMEKVYNNQNKTKQNKNETAPFEEGENLVSRVTTLLDSNAFSTKKSQGMQKNGDV